MVIHKARTDFTSKIGNSIWAFPKIDDATQMIGFHIRNPMGNSWRLPFDMLWPMVIANDETTYSQQPMFGNARNLFQIAKCPLPDLSSQE